MLQNAIDMCLPCFKLCSSHHLHLFHDSNSPCTSTPSVNLNENHVAHFRNHRHDTSSSLGIDRLFALTCIGRGYSPCVTPRFCCTTANTAAHVLCSLASPSACRSMVIVSRCVMRLLRTSILLSNLSRHLFQLLIRTSTSGTSLSKEKFLTRVPRLIIYSPSASNIDAIPLKNVGLIATSLLLQRKIQLKFYLQSYFNLLPITSRLA